MAGATDSADESNLTGEAAAGDDAKASAGAGDAASSAGAPQCMPCRGSGKVLSNLGGESSLVSCPWCEGTGVRQQGVDAQQHWREREGAESASAASAESSAAS
jgi:hypothetical protein